MRLHSAACVAIIFMGAVLGGTRAAGADLVADFSTNNNPNGVWSYGWAAASGGPFQLTGTAIQFQNGQSVGWWNGLSLPDTCVIDKDYANYFSSGSVLFYPDTLHLDPQSHTVMARFTAPSNGNYQITGLFRIQDTGAQPHDLTIVASGATTNFHVLASGGYNTQYPFAFAAALTAGETMDFEVGCHNGQFYNLGTGLKVTVTNAIGNFYTWTGAASSDWFNPRNWSPQGTPGPLDTVFITNGSPTVGSATNVGSVILGGGTLNAGSGLTVSNQFNWSGGSLNGTLTVGTNATMNLNYPGGNLPMQGATLINNGTAVWYGGTLQYSASTVITNNGTWLAESDDTVFNGGGGGPAFYNNGLFTKSPSSGTTTFANVAFNNAGTVALQTGTLNVGSGGQIGGVIGVSSNATLNFSGGGFLNATITTAATSEMVLSGGTFTYGPGLFLSGLGNMQLTGGNITLTNTTISNLLLNGGTITLSPNFQGGFITNLSMGGGTLSGTYNVTGTFDFNGTINGGLTVIAGAACYITNVTIYGPLIIGTNATLNFVSENSKFIYGGTMVNNGTVVWDGGTLYFTAGTAVTNNGLWLAETDDVIYNGQGGAPVFYNNGVFTKSPTTGSTQISGLEFDNTGTLDVQTGTVILDSGGQFLGNFLVAEGAELNMAGGGYLNGTNTVAASGEIVLTGGNFTYGPGLDFAGPGVSLLQGNASITFLNDIIPNLTLNGGTLSLGSNFQGGTITNFTLTGATLVGTNTVTGVMHWQSGEIAGIFTVASNAVLYLDGNNDVSQYANLTNAGHIVWSGSANWRLFNDAGLDGSIQNLTNAVIDIECNQTLYSPNGNQMGWLNNLGVIRKSLSGTTTSLSVNFTNAGILEILTGSINFGYGVFGGQIMVGNGTGMYLGNGGVLSGTFVAGVESLVDLTSGVFTQSPSVALMGPGTYEMTGNSTLTLLNSTIPNLQLNGGNIYTASGFQGGTITNLNLNGESINTSNLVTGNLTGVGNINAPLVVASNASLTWNGTVNATITVMPGATLNWEGGSLNTALYIPTNAVLNALGYSGMQMVLVTNAGTVNWLGGSLRLCCNNNFYNLPGATFNIESDQSFNNYYNGENFVNAGLVRKLPTPNSPTTSTTYFNVFMDNTGVVDAQDGTIYFANYTTNSAGGIYQCESNAELNFDGGANLLGSYTAADGGDVVFSGGTFTISQPMSFNGPGGYLVTGGTFNLTNSIIPNLQMVGGTIDFPTNFQGGSITNLTLNGSSIGSSNYVTGNLTVNGNIDGPLTIASNATLTWNGTINGPLTVMPGATLNWEGGVINSVLYIPSNAVLNALGYSGMQSVLITNAGTVNWTGGNLRLCCNNNFYNLAGAVFNIECDQSFYNYYNGENFINAGLIRKSGTSGTTYISVFVDNTGVVDAASGTLYFANFATNSIEGVYQCESNASLNFNAGANLSGAYTAAAGGEIQFSGGTFDILSPMYLNGAGAYQITGGAFNLTNSLIPNLQMIGGTVNFPANFQGGSITNVTLNGAGIGSSNYVTGNLTVYGNINGPLTIASNATLTWNGTVNGSLTVMPGATLNWQGGVINSALYIPPNAVLNALGYSGMQMVLTTNAGTVNWTGGSMRLCCNNSFYNLAGGVFNIECDQSLYNYYNGEYLYNEGLIRKSGTSGTTYLDTFVNNSGVIDTESGEIYFNNAVIPAAGTWEIGIDGPGNNGVIGFSGTAPLGANLSVHLNNGYVLGLSNAFTLMGYPSFSGTFLSTNLPSEGASWQLNLGSTATTLLLTNLQAPQNVVITTPSNNQPFTIPVNIPITATAADPYAAISAVQFFAGTNLLGQATSSPYTYLWNSAPPGFYTITALAIDAAGAMSTSPPVNIAVYYNHAQTTNFTWTGAVSSDWFTAGNWSPSGVPGVLDNVILANNGTINLTNNVSINNFTLSSGTLNGSSTLTVTNTVNWSGGTINTPLTLATNATMTLSGGPTLNALLINNGSVNWLGGDLGGNGSSTITNNGLWSSPYGGHTIRGGLFVNNGTLQANGPGVNIYLGGNAFINNGLSDAETGAIWFNSGGTLSGTYNANAAGGIYFNGGTFALGVLPAFTGNGVFQFSGGTLDASSTIPPILQLTGGTVVLGPVFQNAGAITNLTIAGSTLTGSNTVIGTMNFPVGSINGSLTIEPTGVLTMSSGNTRYVSSLSLVNAGLVVWNGGNINGDANTIVTNNGVWLNECDASITFDRGQSIFANNSLFQKTNSYATTYVNGMLFTNNGTVDAENGTINFQDGGTLNGTYNAAAGAAVVFSGGTFTLGNPPAMTGAGAIRFTGGTMNVVGTSIPANLQLTGGTFTLSPAFENGGEITSLTNSGSTLSGSYTVTGTLASFGGSFNGSLTIASNASLIIGGNGIHLGNCVFTNNGTVNWMGGTVNGNSATVAVNNGLWLASSGNNFQNGDCCGTLTFTNNGTFRNTANTTYFYGVSVNNYGLVDVEGGVVNFNYGGLLGANYNVAQFCGLYFSGGSFSALAPPVIEGAGVSELTGGTLTLVVDQIPNLALVGGDVAIGSSFQNGGAITNLTISGSTLIGSNNISGTMNWVAGSLNGSWLNVENDGLLNFTTGNNKNLGNSVLVNNGTVVWTGGAIQGNSGTLITNNGLWQIQTDNAFNNNVCCGNPLFVNNGVFSKSVTYGATTFNGVSVLNSGTFDVESGLINFINGSTYGQTSATLEFGVAALNLAGQLALPGGVSIDGTLTVHFLNGYAPRLGDIIIPVTFGSSTGAFANLNLPGLATGQSWNLEYSAGGVDLSVVAPATPATNTLQISGAVTGPGNTPISNVTVYATLNASNLVVNGSFEQPSIGGNPYVLYSVGSTAIPGWTLIGPAGANVDITSAYWAGPAEDGNQFFDPTGNTGSGGATQSVPTVPGTLYDLIFYHGTYARYGYTNSLGVTLGANTYAFGETSGGGGNLDWRPVVIPFTATSNFTTLSFYDTTGRNADDNFVDNVQVLQPGANSVLQAVTDSNGNYQLNVPKGTLAVGVSGLPAAGYNPVATQTVVVSNANQVVNFSATPAAVPQMFTITTGISPAGAGTVSGGGAYSSGASVTVNATAVTTLLPYSFSAWTENGVFQSASPSYTFTAIRDRDLVANFVLPVFAITASNNPPAAGTVSGAGSFTYGTTNTLTAFPSFGYTFSNWTEGASVVGTSPTLNTVVFAAHNFVANYAAANVTHVVTTVTVPPGLALVAGAGTYNNGQTANFSAPLLVTNSPYLYTFQQFTLSNTLASASNAFSKTFSTLDPTNLQYTAVYSSSTILPRLTNVTVNYAPLVPSTTNFVLRLQFDRSMNTNVAPVVVLSNSAASIQPIVANNGSWSSFNLLNDTYATPPITISPGMDGTMQLFVSAAQDTNGDMLALTNFTHFTIEATPPPNPVLTAVASNSSSITVSWSGYSAPADLAGFRIYLEPTNYASVTGLPVLTGLGAGATSYQFNNLALDTPYYAAVQAVDTAGNSVSSVTPLEIILSSSLPPAVPITVTAVGPSSALLSWNSYNTAGLLGFAGFYVYSQQSNFTTVNGLTPQATVGPGQFSYQVNGLDRARTNYFAVVGFNEIDDFYPNVFTTTWTDPYAGTITANTTIGGNGTTLVPIYKSITVNNNATLTVQPGTTLQFAPGTSLTVAQGRLAADGAALAPIIFDSANDVSGRTPAPGDWGGVVLGSGAGSSSLQFVEILYGGGLTINGCSPSVQALTANFNAPDGLLVENGASLTTASALVSGNQVGVEQADTATLNVTGSVIQNNQTNGWASGSAAMNAISNWWGASTQSGLTPLLAGNVIYSPFLISEPVLTPAIGASNGLTQVGNSSVALQLACRTATSMRLSEDFTFNGVFFTPYSNYATFALSAGGGLKHIFAEFRSVTGATNVPVELDVNYITQGPVIQSFSLTDGETLSRPVTVTGSATAVLGMKDLELYLDGSLLATNAGGSLSYYLDVRALNNAIHQAQLVARDLSGNITTLEEDVIVAVTPPLAPNITQPGSDYVTNNNNLNIRGTAEPNITIQVTDNGQLVGTTQTDGSGNFSVTNLTLSEGVNTIVAIASDSTGSTPSPARHTTVETVPPVAVTMNAPVYSQASGLSVSWSLAAAGKQPSTFEVFWASSSFTSTNQATGHSTMLNNTVYRVQGLPTGTYYFGVVGFDAAGNPSPLSALVSAVYDPTPPALTIAYSSNSPVGPGPLLVTLASSKGLAGLPSLTIQPYGAPSPASLPLTNVALNTWQTGFLVTSATPSGTVGVTASAQDLVGNVFNGAPSGPALVIDTTPPSGAIVTSPAGPVQTTNNVSVSVNLTLTKPVAQGTIPTLSFTPPQGASSNLTLTGAGTNWNVAIQLTPAMGSGFCQFAYSSEDAVGNVGSNLTAGAQLELYNTALPTAPAAPINLTAVSLPGGYVALRWNAVGNAQIYRLYRESGTNFVLPATLDIDNISSTTVTDLPPADGLYSYGISASRLGSESAISNEVIALSDRTPPPAPTNVVVQLAAVGVQITWQEPSGEVPDHYNIYRNGTLIKSVPAILPVTDYPPRGTDSYIVSSVDSIGNENASAPAVLQLQVSPVNNLSVLVSSGQSPALSWISTDPTVTGYNLYRNGVKQNATPLTTPSYVDNFRLSDVTSYGVTALNALSQESPQRLVQVFPVGMSLLADGGMPLVLDYFDSIQVGLTNLSPTATLPLTEIVLNRTITGTEPMSVTQVVTSINASSSLSQTVILPEASVAANQTMTVNAFQQVDAEGDSVEYQQSFLLTNSQLPAAEMTITANQPPLAGGLTAFTVDVFNRGYAPMQFIVSRGFNATPGDVYISVQNNLGQELSRTRFLGTPPGTTFALDGTGYVNIAPGASLSFTVPNVLTPEALVASSNVIFAAGVSAIYNQIETPQESVSGPISGSMVVASLALPPYYGISITDQPFYTNDQPVLINGKAISQSTGLPVPNAALNVGFFTRGYQWFQPVTTDTSGNFQYTFNPPPGFAGSLTIWAANPQVVDQLNQNTIEIDRLYCSPSSEDIEMSKNGTVSFTVQLFNPGDLPLTAIATSFSAYQVSGTNLTPITTVTGTNLSGTSLTVGPNQHLTVTLELAAAANAPDSAEVVFTFTSAAGAAAALTGVVDLLPAIPVVSVLAPASGYLQVSLNRGSESTGQLTIENSGLETLSNITVLPPTNAWIALNLPVSTDGLIHLPDLPIGQSNSIGVVFSPPITTALAYYPDTVTIQASNLSTPYAINVYALVTSDLTGGVQFEVDDILGEQVSGASVMLNNPLIQSSAGPFYTDTNGLLTVTNLEEGIWNWEVAAPGCSANVGTVTIVADQVAYQPTRLSRSLVTVSFSVVPVPFSDQYDIQISQTFETYVPAGVLVLQPPSVDYENVTPGFQANFICAVQNYGLIQMTDLTITGSQSGAASITPLITYVPVLLPEQVIDVPMSTTYGLDTATNGHEGTVQSRQGADVAGCVAGAIGSAFGFGELEGDDADFANGVAALLNAQERCVKDDQLQNTTAALAAMYALGQLANDFSDAASFVASVAANAVGCMIGNLLAGIGGGIPGAGSYASSPVLDIGQPVGCFTADTLVRMADGTEKPISSIAMNDMVQAGQNSWDVASVGRVLTFPVEKLQSIEFDKTYTSPEGRILATPEHLFWVDGKGWRQAAQLKQGDWLFNFHGERVRVAGNKAAKNPMKVYTLMLVGDSAFYANGLLVHDMCGAAKPASAKTVEVVK